MKSETNPSRGQSANGDDEKGDGQAQERPRLCVDRDYA